LKPLFVRVCSQSINQSINHLNEHTVIGQGKN